MMFDKLEITATNPCVDLRVTGLSDKICAELIFHYKPQSKEGLLFCRPCPPLMRRFFTYLRELEAGRPYIALI